MTLAHGPSPVRSRAFSIRLSPAELAPYEQEAARRQVTVATLMREALAATSPTRQPPRRHSSKPPLRANDGPSWGASTTNTASAS